MSGPKQSSVRSLLFVPGSRPDRFTKAMASGADAVCIDFEDSVVPAQKSAARRDGIAFLAAQASNADRRVMLGLRCNAIRSADGVRDLAALADAETMPDFLMLPKTADAVELAIVSAILPGVDLWPIVESAAGLAQASAIAQGCRVGGLLFGAVDFAAESGCTLDWEALLFARGALACARAGAGTQLLDVPLLDAHDDGELTQSSERARALGFTGRACIHPSQVAAVNRVFTPSADEVARAGRLVEAFAGAAGGVALLDGRLVEKPVALAAERVLQRARQFAGQS